MKEINYIKQPTEYLCGQSCVAMLAGVTVEEVISVMQNDKGTGKKDIDILKVFLPKYAHWILYYHGKYYDPEFGLMDELYPKARIQSYLVSAD